MAEGISTIAGYIQSDQDQSATSPQYYGYQGGNGVWYIMQVINTSGVYSYRYFSGSGGSANYSTNWTNRSSLNYDYYSKIFLNF